MPDHLLRRREEQIDVAAERVLQHRRGAAIGDVRDLDAERLRQQGGGEMSGRADAGMAHPRRRAFFIQATSSGSVLASSVFRPTSTSGLELIMAIGRKSFSVSNGSDL